MRIYFAAPLFNAAEQRFNARLTWQLEERGHRVFLPQRDGHEMAATDETDDPLGQADQRRRIFERDSAELIAADLVLAVLDGRVPDEGVCVEIGIAWATRATEPGQAPRRIVGLRTDARGWLPNEALNPMVSEALDALFTDEQALLTWLSSLPSEDDMNGEQPTD